MHQTHQPHLLLTHLTFVCLLLALTGCADDDDAAGAAEQEVREFNRHLVLLDEALTDDGALDVNDVQDMLEQTPHGNRSVLADYVSNGRSAAEAIIDAARTHRINPIVILTRTQMEQSLIGKSEASSKSLDWAMGCGCLDNKQCIEAYRGFDAQVDCMASRLRSYLDELDTDGATVAGWRVGERKSTLDGYSVTPKNRATAALYTYTPWVSSNKLHAGIFANYAAFFDYQTPAPGGCPSLTYPSGVRIQLVPVAELAAQYGSAQQNCFIDTAKLFDPSGSAHDVSVKLADNFRLSEFAAAASSGALLLEPELVDALQRTREQLASSISIRLSYQSPTANAELCQSASAPSCQAGDGLMRGEGVLVDSGASTTAVLDAAARVGVPSCWADNGMAYIGVEASALGCPR